MEQLKGGGGWWLVVRVVAEKDPPDAWLLPHFLTV